jgi:[acyl-carrier-protein] S-malonyltransferase
MSVDQSVAVLFPGQGAQRPGMGRPWRQSPAWELVGEISGWTGVDVAHLLLDADERELRRTDRAQLAVFTVGVLAHAEAVRAGVLGRVAGYAGHSLGEYVALYAAGAAGLRDCAVLVARRGAEMLRAARRRPGAMAALMGADVGAGGAERLVEECRKSGHSVWVANLNGPRQVVVSGTEAGIAAVGARAAASGLRCVRLEVAGAFHSPLMAPAARAFRRDLDAAPFDSAHAPVAANVDGALRVSGELWPDLMTAQITGAVRWEDCVRTLSGELGVRRFVELGPGRTLSGLATRIDSSLSAVSAGTPDEVAALTAVAA